MRNIFKNLWLPLLCAVTGVFSQASAQPYQLKLTSNTDLVRHSYRFEDVYFTSATEGHIVSGIGNINKTYDGGETWVEKLFDNLGAFRSIEFLDDGKTGIAGSLSSKLYRTTNGGETWQDISSSISDTGDRVRVCGLSHYGNTFYGVGWWGGTTARVYKSTDGGITWTTKYLDKDLVTSLVDIVCMDEHTLVASGGRDYTSTVVRSTDGGETWNKVFGNDLGDRIWKLQFLNDKVGFGSVQPLLPQDTVNIIKTTDGGQNWTLIPIGRAVILNYNVGTQAVGFLDENRGWVGGYYNGYFETFDGGATWRRGTDTTIGNMNRMFRINDSTIFATCQKGVAKTVSMWPSKVGAIGKPSSPAHILKPVSPNPANQTINIEFEAGRPSNFVLEVISVEQKVCKRIMEAPLEAGVYRYNVDISGYPAGVYVVKLGNDDIHLVQKFVIQH